MMIHQNRCFYTEIHWHSQHYFKGYTVMIRGRMRSHNCYFYFFVVCICILSQIVHSVKRYLLCRPLSRDTELHNGSCVLHACQANIQTVDLKYIQRNCRFDIDRDQALKMCEVGAISLIIWSYHCFCMFYKGPEQNTVVSWYNQVCVKQK